MKSNSEVIAALNSNLKFELTAINQLFLHSRIARNWGLNGLADANYKVSIDAMKTADSLIDRILFLEGLPNLQLLGKISIGENVREIIECDLRTFQSGRSEYLKSIELCETHIDYESRSQLTTSLEAVEEHIDHLETQIWLMDSMDIENYIQAQI